jgi:hypothetical protein
MVRYRVRPDRVDENVALVRAVYAALADLTPDGFHYTTHRGDDGVTFVQLATDDGAFPLADVPAFRDFRDGLDERCQEPPVRLELTEVGAYQGPDS